MSWSNIMSWSTCVQGSRAQAVSGMLALAALVNPITFPEKTTAQEVTSPVEQVFGALDF